MWDMPVPSAKHGQCHLVDAFRAVTAPNCRKTLVSRTRDDCFGIGPTESPALPVWLADRDHTRSAGNLREKKMTRKLIVSALAVTAVIGSALAVSAQERPMRDRGERMAPQHEHQPQRGGERDRMDRRGDNHERGQTQRRGMEQRGDRDPHAAVDGLFNFGLMDLNGDGQVTVEEIEAAKAARFAAADTNGDGLLSVEEFAAARERRAEELRAARRAHLAQQMVERLDRNGDGQLSAEELEPPTPAQRFVNRFDADGDGTVTTEEFQERSTQGGRRDRR